ncbi:MAG: hypothetical protein JWO31_155 [Phycisphaerales bacterium]|nr:hypothetical protein [Phycisphaerales bacterium]
MDLGVLAQTFSGRLVQYYLDLLTSGTGMVAVAGFLLLACAALVWDATRWVWLSVMFFLSTFSLAREANAAPITAPFSYVAAAAQPAAYAMLLLLLIAAVKPGGAARGRPSAVLVALFALQLVLVARYLIGGYTEKAVVGLVTFALLFVGLGLGIGSWVAAERKAVPLARAVAGGAVLVMLAGLGQYAISPAAAFVAGRLSGATPNAVRFAIALAVTVPFTLYLSTTPRVRGLAKTAFVALLVVTILSVVATGSRGASLAAVVAIVTFFRTRLGPVLAIGLLVTAAGIGVAAGTSGDFLGSAERLTSAGNTRAEVWTTLLATFRANPLLGADYEGALGESSYLSVAAGMGLVGLVPLAVLLVAIFAAIRTCVRVRPRLGDDDRGLADLAISGLATMLCLWTFEAYLLSLVSDVMIAFYAIVAVYSAVTARAAAAAADLPTILIPEEGSEFGFA